ncbi:hypothetical protein CROQUDRAFT_652901 [Cronartium quercuum f. sp. fusiforme G11]|uniref:Uncharacterized protein n=1 Tax=Cronartium quercuum f. sp. fusiforme G11 TaxID=708437 RepID=A0A9P6NT77_9BASI|nr:hypothetical protein CROQUDRAFT_652901 [Cronartium quercuum f. sp. fusiforme G11]
MATASLGSLMLPLSFRTLPTTVCSEIRIPDSTQPDRPQPSNSVHPFRGQLDVRLHMLSPQQHKFTFYSSSHLKLDQNTCPLT